MINHDQSTGNSSGKLQEIQEIADQYRSIFGKLIANMSPPGPSIGTAPAGPGPGRLPRRQVVAAESLDAATGPILQQLWGRPWPTDLH